MSVDLQNLERLVLLVQTLHHEVPAKQVITHRLFIVEGGRADNKGAGDVYRVSLGGVTATSTAGWAGALQNWQIAARKRLP